MDAKRSINENHPKYPEYKEKFDALKKQALKEYDEWKEANPDYQGLESEPSKIDKRLSKGIKLLQEEYSYLFENT